MRVVLPAFYIPKDPDVADSTIETSVTSESSEISEISALTLEVFPTALIDKDVPFNPILHAVSPPCILEISPLDILQFTLPKISSNEDMLRKSCLCPLNLKNPGKTSQYIAYKIKTNQPRRYRVHPNHCGILSPAKDTTVTIRLLQKYKKMLLQNCDKLDKAPAENRCFFFVDSFIVDDDMFVKKENATIESQPITVTEDCMTRIWKVAKTSPSIRIFRQKLLVQHIFPNTSKLEIFPTKLLEFQLSKTPKQQQAQSNSNLVPKCLLTLQSKIDTEEIIVFKVKTTQPRRYRVSPEHEGIIGRSESKLVSIRLLEKYRLALLKTADKFGPEALNHCKDKFYLTYCVVNNNFLENSITQEKEEKKVNQMGPNTLSKIWNAVKKSETIKIEREEFQVRHIIATSRP